MSMRRSMSGKTRPERGQGRSAVSAAVSSPQGSEPARRPLTANGSGAGLDVFAEMQSMGHEQVLLSHDPSCGYFGIIAIHDTTLGPALGGTRFWQYATTDEAIMDALRLGLDCQDADCLSIEGCQGNGDHSCRCITCLDVDDVGRLGACIDGGIRLAGEVRKSRWRRSCMGNGRTRVAGTARCPRQAPGCMGEFVCVLDNEVQHLLAG